MIQRRDLERRFSHSKINSFRECKAYYKNKYIDQVPVVGTEPHFLLGSAYHAGMEHLYLTEPLHKTPAQVQALVRAGIDEFFIDWFTKEEIIDLIDDFMEYEEFARVKLEELNWRCSADCNDPKLWIRKPKTNEVYKVPEMSTKYKDELAKLGLAEKSSALDTKANELSETMRNSNFSLSEVFVTAYMLGAKYQEFPDLVKVHGVELAFTQPDPKDPEKFTNYVEIGGKPFQGFIDLFPELKSHGKTLMDHKTAKAEVSALEVLYHEQLNLYVYAMKIGYGIIIDSIGINNARFGTKVIVPVNWSIVEQIVARKAAEVQDIIREEEFRIQDPFNKYAAKKCLGFSNPPYVGSSRKGVCPYLPVCHPELYDHFMQLDLQAELEKAQVNQVFDFANQPTPVTSMDKLEKELFF